MDISIARVVDVSVSQVPTGVGAYNTSNIGLFTSEIPADSFGDLGYAIYFSPDQGATDFGTDSETYAMLLAIFSQQPNILANDGYVVVIPFINAEETATLSGVAASGTFELTFTEGTTVAINWNDTASMIQAKINALSGLEGVVVTGSISSRNPFTLLTVVFTVLVRLLQLLRTHLRLLVQPELLSLGQVQSLVRPWFKRLLARTVSFNTLQSLRMKFLDRLTCWPLQLIAKLTKKFSSLFQELRPISSPVDCSTYYVQVHLIKGGLYCGSSDDLTAILYAPGILRRTRFSQLTSADRTQRKTCT